MSAERPALYEHCVIIWDSIAAEAVMTDIDGVVLPVYTGFLTKLFTENLLSVPYYTQVMTALKRMDCIRQLRRGGGAAPSEWILMQKPTLEIFRQRMSMPAPSSAKKQDQEQLLQMLRDLGKRVSKMEDRIKYLESIGEYNGYTSEEESTDEEG